MYRKFEFYCCKPAIILTSLITGVKLPYLSYTFLKSILLCFIFYLQPPVFLQPFAVFHEALFLTTKYHFLTVKEVMVVR